MSNLLHWSYQSSSTCTVVVDEENSEALAKTDENILKNVTTKGSRVPAALGGGTSWSNASYDDPGGLLVGVVDLMHGVLPAQVASAPALLFNKPNSYPEHDYETWSGRKLLQFSDEPERATEQNAIDIILKEKLKEKIEYDNLAYEHKNEALDKNEIIYTAPESNNILDVKTSVNEMIRKEDHREKSDHILLNISIASDSKAYKPVSLSLELPSNSDPSRINLESALTRNNDITDVEKPNITNPSVGRLSGGECQCFCPCMERGSGDNSSSAEVRNDTAVIGSIESTESTIVHWNMTNWTTLKAETDTLYALYLESSTDSMEIDEETISTTVATTPDEPRLVICTGNSFRFRSTKEASIEVDSTICQMSSDGFGFVAFVDFGVGFQLI